MEDMGPCEKRARLSKGEHPVDDMEVPQHPVAVLADEYTEPVLLVEAVSCPILDKREASRLLKEFGTHLPLGSLQHLKRVRPGQEKDSPLEILVAPLSSIQSPEDDEEVTADLVSSYLSKHEISFAGLGDPQIVKVCCRQPSTRQQFNDVRKHWPSNFHENKELGKKVTRLVFNETQLRRHAKFMRQAIEQAQQAGSAGECVGAVVVDPRTSTVIAAGHDNRYLHPLQHATMVVVDLVANSQGGGAWNLSGEVTSQEGSSDINIKEGPYLCTGYDMYITREPCCMCAMGLVHSRVRTVFYGAPTAHGALGTIYKVNCKTGLNHHYDVYSGFMSKQCEELSIPQDKTNTWNLKIKDNTDNMSPELSIQDSGHSKDTDILDTGLL